MKSGVIRRMHQNPATKPLEKVPGHSHLFRRGARYYFRIGVPENLRSIVGRRELIKSLNTADFKAALERVSVQEQACREILRSARVRYEANKKGKATPKPFEPLIVTSEKHAAELARIWFLEIERQGAQWWQENRQKLSEVDRNEELADLWHMQAAITGEGDDKIHETDFNDGKLEVRTFLQFHRLTIDEQSEGFGLLARLFREARLEYVRRQQDRIAGKPMKAYGSLFRDLSENTPMLPLRKVFTVKQLTTQFIDDITKADKAPKTVFQYQVTARLLCELFGERGADSITREDAEKFCTLLETIPGHMRKRYPKMSISAAIEKAKKLNDTSRLAPNTRRNRFFSAFTIFKYGLETKQLSNNPFDDRLQKERFTPKENDTDEDDVRPFTIEELNKIFQAPLFTGCKDDRRGYAKPGVNVFRRGRFWGPLVGLFQGMRENEICQLHTADVCDWEGGLYLELRAGDDKRLKNRPSKRAVPVHPELLRLGFGEYVAARRANTTSPRLFPELTMAKTKSYSDNYSKWFSHFLLKIFGTKIEATFHSFRHSFTDACRIADVSPQRIDRLAGWAGEGRQQRHYGRDKLIAALAADLSRVEYKELNISHLYVQPAAPEPPCRKRTRTLPIPPLQEAAE